MCVSVCGGCECECECGCECVWVCGCLCECVCRCECECVGVTAGLSPANPRFQPSSLLRCPPSLGLIGGGGAEDNQMTEVSTETAVLPMREHCSCVLLQRIRLACKSWKTGASLVAQ